MAAAARAARGAIGGHSPALQIVRRSRSRSTQLQWLQDRSAEVLELRRGRAQWEKEKCLYFYAQVSRVGSSLREGVSRSEVLRKVSVMNLNILFSSLSWSEEPSKVGVLNPNKFLV
jgi:hypothetical protein